MTGIIYSVLISFFASLAVGYLLIPVLKILKLGQTIREEGPKSHSIKAGTPTFGGIIFILASMLTILIFPGLLNRDFMLAAYSLIAFGFVGFTDDFLKKIHKKNEGLTPGQKMFMLLAVSTIFTLYAYQSSSIGTVIFIPFTHKTFDLGPFYIPFTVFFYLSVTNAVNITDGLDGLAGTVTLLVMVFFTLAGYNAGYYGLSVFCSAVSGALIGFLRFNSYPAKIIMGDTGSLALGGMVATVAVMLKNPLIILIIGGIYVMEILSDVIQIASYKLRGKRVFKMAPIHHSFEISGWHEAKIVSTFAIATAILCLIGFLAL